MENDLAWAFIETCEQRAEHHRRSARRECLCDIA